MDGKNKEFQTTMGFDTESPIARYPHYTQIYERTIFTSALLQQVTGSGHLFPFHRNTGIANTTYYNLGIDANLTKDLKASLDGFLLNATETGAWEDYLSFWYTSADVDDDLGWEVDAKVSYKIAKNLTYFVEAGYFSPGGFYGDVMDAIYNSQIDKKSVTQVIHGLNLTF